jgi:flagellin-like hook-associated protein FlgL
MSGSITMIGVTGNATLTRLVQDSQATHTQLDKISNQVSTGLIADNYAGLGTGAQVSLNLHPQIASMQAWQNNVDAVTGRMSVAQSSLTQIQSIAANFYAQLNNVQSVNTSAIDTIAASARDALRQVAGLLDTQDGGVYVFGGQDTGNPPVPNPDQITDTTANPTGFFATIQADVGKLGAQPAAWVAQQTLGVASSGGGPSPFSSYLSTTQTPTLPTVQVGQNQTEVSRPAESHRQALAELCVRLSPHTAPIVRPYPCNNPQCANSNGWRRAMRATHCCVRRRCRRRDLNFRCAHRANMRSMWRRVG